MTVHQLRIFEVVSRHLNITRAAAELRISEPSAYQQIKSLEESCGFRLYGKTGRGIELTLEGQKLRAEVSDIVNRVESLEQRFKALRRSSPVAGSLVVGGSHMPSKSILPSCLAVFKQSHPLVKITLQTRNSRSIEKSIINSKLEIAIITHPSGSPRLQYLPFGQERVVLFVSPRHKLAKSKTLKLADIAAIPLIIHRGIQRGTGENTLAVMNRIEALGAAPTILMECNSAEAVKAGVLGGLGIGILMQAHLDNELQKREVKILTIRDLKEMWVPSFIVFRKDRPLSDNAQTFADMLRKSARYGVATN